MRTFYVTLNKATCDYLSSTMYEEVKADDVNVGPAGELAFCMDVENGDRYVSVVYAPGTWVLFTEANS